MRDDKKDEVVETVSADGGLSIGISMSAVPFSTSASINDVREFHQVGMSILPSSSSSLSFPAGTSKSGSGNVAQTPVRISKES